MRRFLAAGAVVIILVALIGNLPSASSDTPEATPSGSTSDLTARSTPGPTATAAAANTPVPLAPAGKPVKATVVRVVDGDTIVVEFGGARHRVRYIGVDAPEKASSDSPAEWLAGQATKANAALVEGKTVYLEKDVSEVDRFDRLLRHVWLKNGSVWTLVNLELVRRGVADAKSYPPDVGHDDLYAAAEAAARLSAVGLFGATPAPPTPKPKPKPTPKPSPRPKAKPARTCHPSYLDACLKVNAGDYDCAGGSGNGPNYVFGTVRVVGYDEFDLDADGDGYGCE